MIVMGHEEMGDVDGDGEKSCRRLLASEDHDVIPYLRYHRYVPEF